MTAVDAGLAGPDRAASGGDAGGARAPRGGRGWHSRLGGADAATAVFAAVALLPTVLHFVHGRRQWFTLDEWDFLAGRELSSIDDLFSPHNEHWVTIPIVLYRVLFRLFGLNTYVPYQAMIIGLHVATAALLFVIMRRCRVNPWIATAAASLFALFGSGDLNLMWAVQVTEVGSLTFGLVHLLLADHDGPVTRRDILGVLAGLAAVMSSGLGVVMVMIVGGAVLVRRGWRAALVHVAPLAVIFAAWWLTFGRDAYDSTGSSVRDVPSFVTAGIDATFDALGQVTLVGWALAVVLAVGLVLLVRERPPDLRRRFAAPGAMLVGTVVLLAIAGLGRTVYGANFARQGRWSHIVGALALPAIAIAADAVARRWHVLLPVMIGLFLVGIPGNVDKIVRYDERNAFLLGNRELITTLPNIPLAREVPRWIRPEPIVGPELTIGWLLDAKEAGRLPDPRPLEDTTVARAAFRLSIAQVDEPFEPRACRALVGSERRDLEAGDRIVFDGGPLRVDPLGELDVSFTGRTYSPQGGSTLRIVAPLSVRLSPGGDEVVLCDASR
jgi:hypothetical protein